MNACVAVDLGGTFLRCAIVTGDDIVMALERIRIPGNPSSRTPAVWRDVVGAVAAYVTRHAREIPAESPIAFSFPGPVADGAVRTAPTLGGDTPLPDIRAQLADRAGRDVVLINDVSAAAWYFADRMEAGRFLVVTVSSGIGAKIFDRRHPLGVIDDVPFAGEIGHLVVDTGPAAPRCDCGGVGHLGAFASARGFERNAVAAARTDAAGFARSHNVTQLGATAATLTNEAHLVPALQAEDRWTLGLLRRAVDPLAHVMRVLSVGGGLDGIALMGGFAQALGAPYRALVADAVGRLSDRGPACSDAGIPIVLAAPGEEPSLVGAATFARKERAVTFARARAS